MQITCAPKHTAQTGLSIYLSVSLCLSLSLPLFVSLSLSLSVVGQSGYAELCCVSVCVCVCVWKRGLNVCTRAERLIAFAISSRYDRTRFSERKRSRLKTWYK